MEQDQHVVDGRSMDRNRNRNRNMNINSSNTLMSNANPGTNTTSNPDHTTKKGLNPNPLLDDDWSDSDEDPEETHGGTGDGSKRPGKVPRLMVSQGGQLISRHMGNNTDTTTTDQANTATISGTPTATTTASTSTPTGNHVTTSTAINTSDSLLLFDLPSFFIETDTTPTPGIGIGTAPVPFNQITHPHRNPGARQLSVPVPLTLPLRTGVHIRNLTNDVVSGLHRTAALQIRKTQYQFNLKKQKSKSKK